MSEPRFRTNFYLKSSPGVNVERSLRAQAGEGRDALEHRLPGHPHADNLRQQSGGPLFLAFVRRASALGADKEFLAVLEGDVAAVGAVCAVLRLIAFDDDLGAREQRILRPTAAEECVRRAGF